MTIRTTQICDMRKRMDAEYIDRLARHVESRYRAAAESRGLVGAKLRTALDEAIAGARQYGIERAADLELYADCVALLGPDFDRNPACAWAGATLRRSDLCGKEKMDEISEDLIFGPEGPR